MQKIETKQDISINVPNKFLLWEDGVKSSKETMAF